MYRGLIIVARPPLSARRFLALLPPLPLNGCLQQQLITSINCSAILHQILEPAVRSYVTGDYQRSLFLVNNALRSHPRNVEVGPAGCG
jgi:hypothetical protein